jgi:hypothetical protein
VDLHKVVVRRSAFLAFPSAQNRGESKGGLKNERLKCQFTQMEGDLDLQEIPKLVSFQRKEQQRKIKWL